MKLELVNAGDTRFRDWMRRYREEIAGEAPPESWLDHYLDALFADQGKRRHIWWAVDNGRKIGFAVVVLSKHWADQARTQAQIGEFFVYPEYRREGYGRRMAEAVIEFLNGQGANDIHASVTAGNVRGLRFWEACSFMISRYVLVHRPGLRREEEDEDEL